MIATLALGLGMVLVFEGLVFALAPGRLEDLVRVIADIPVETRRLLGLSAVAAGVALIWIVV